jgi:hypothetical protein
VSTLRAPTRGFRIGVRVPQTRIGLAGVPLTPAETPARAADFKTHPVYRGLHGMGVALPATNNDLIIGGSIRGGNFLPAANGNLPRAPVSYRPFNPGGSQIPAASAAAGSTTTTATPASTTPVASAPAAAAQPQTYTDQYGNVWTLSARGWVLTSAGSSMQTTPTPQTSSTTPTPTGVSLTSGAATTAQAGTPVPVNWPTSQTYTDSSGNIWGYESGSWQIISYVSGSAAASQAATLLAATGSATGSTAGPVGAPTSAIAGQTFTDASGNIWTYSGTGWTLTSSASSAANWMASLTAFLQSDTIIAGVQNFWLIGGAGAAALLLMDFSSRKR